MSKEYEQLLDVKGDEHFNDERKDDHYNMNDYIRECHLHITRNEKKYKYIKGREHILDKQAGFNFLQIFAGFMNYDGR